MHSRTALLAFVLFLANASFAHANVAYRVYEDDPRRAQSVVGRSVLGFALGAMLISAIGMHGRAGGVGKRFADVLVVVSLCGLIGVVITHAATRPRYMEGNRPETYDRFGPKDGNRIPEAEKEQAINPMTSGLILGVVISVAGLLLVRWFGPPRKPEEESNSVQSADPVESDFHQELIDRLGRNRRGPVDANPPSDARSDS